MINRLLSLLLLSSLLTASSSLAQPDRITGQELAAQLRALTPDQPITLTADLEVKRNGAITHTPITTRIILKPDSWQSIYQARTPQQIEQLTITHHPGQPNEYSHAQSSSALPSNPQHLDHSQLTTAFANSDFSLFDLGREFLHWPRQTILKSQMRKSRSCKVLESKPEENSSPPYSRVVSWIDNETGGIVIAEAYDHQGKMLKEFETRKVRKINDRYQVDLQIWNLQTKSRTRLQFHDEQSDDPRN